MKLTDDQRAELADAIAHHPIGAGYYSTSIGIDEARDITDELAPLIEGWLSTPPPGWSEREEWAVAFSHKDGRDLATGSESWVRYWTAPEHHDLVPLVVGVRSATNARAVRRTVRQTPWRTA